MSFLKISSRAIEYRGCLGVIAIFFIYFLVRLYHLGYHDLWYDEIYSVNYAQHPWNNWNAPLYWIFMHFWINLFGISEFSLRFPSLIFNFLTVILVFLLGKNIFNKKISILASFLIGFSPFHIWYAQEARDYSMVLFFGTLSSYVLFKAIKEETFKLWLFFILVSIAGIYTNYFYIFLFIAQGLYIIFFKRFKLNFKEIIFFLIVILFFLHYMPKFLSKFYFVWRGFWIPKPTWKSLIITLENFSLGYNGSYILYIISNILSVIFFISAVWAVHKNKFKESFIFCLSLFVLPITLCFIFSRIFFSVYLDRGLIIFSPYYYLILSLGIININRILRVGLFTILVLILSISVYRYFNDLMFEPIAHHIGTYIKKPIKSVVRFLSENVKRKEDIVAFTNVSTMPGIDFYSHKKISPFYYIFNPKFPDTSSKRPIQESRYCISLHKMNSLEFRRLWVISSDWARSGKFDKNSQSVKEWLDKNLKLDFSKEFDGLWVFRYVPSK